MRRSVSAARLLNLLWVLAIAGGCGAAAPEDPTSATDDVGIAREVVVEGFDAVVSDADYDLAMPAAIDVDADGNLWIADQRLHHVLVVSAEGELLRTIGRNGQGPGEFRGPRGVAIRNDKAYVLDVVHGVQRFDMAGDYIDEYPAVRVFFDFDFTHDGGLMASNNRVWARGGMVSALGPDGEERGLIGELAFPDLENFNFGDLREQILQGSIPEALRNGALPVVAPDGSLWVVIHTESTIRRYGPDGTLLAESSFDLPELPGIREQYFIDFAQAQGADAFFLPSFVAAGVAIEDHVLLLWETVPGEPGLITVHDGDGAIVQRLVLPELDTGGGGMATLEMAVDVPRRRLYVSVSDIATVFGVSLPDSVEIVR